MPRFGPAIRTEWSPAADTSRPVGRCKPSCCKTPLGHSIVRDDLPAWHADACKCHTSKENQ